MESQRLALFYITLFVLAMHFSFVMLSWLDFQPRELKKQPPKLVVKTVSLNPKPAKKVVAAAEIPLETVMEPLEQVPERVETLQEVAEAPKIEPEKKPVQQSLEAVPPPPVKKSVVQKAAPKKPAPKKAAVKKDPPVAKKVEKAKPQQSIASPKPRSVDLKKKELLAKAQESIAKIDVSGSKIGPNKAKQRSDLKVPQFQRALVIASSDDESANLNPEELGYRDELASRLQLQLKMPEVGQVKIKLTLSRQGKFMKMAIVASESPANRKYLEKTLPTLNFPGFGNQFGKAEDYTFSITLNSDL